MRYNVSDFIFNVQSIFVPMICVVVRKRGKKICYKRCVIIKKKEKDFSVRMCFDCFAVIFLLFALRCEHFFRHVRVLLRHCDFIDRRIGALCDSGDIQTDLIMAQECTYAFR